MKATRPNPDSIEQHDFVKVIRNVQDMIDISDFWRSFSAHRDMDVDRYVRELINSPQAARPHVLVYYQGGHPTALLVGRYEVKSADLRLGYFQIPMWKVRLLTFLNGALVGDKSAQTCSRFVDSIRASLKSGEADAAIIHHCEIQSPLTAITRSRIAWPLSDRSIKTHVHWMRTLIDENTSSVIGLSARERQHQKRRATRLQDFNGRIQILCFSSDSDLDRMVKDVELVAKKTYQRGLRVGFFDTPQIRNRLDFDARMGWLHAYVLYIEERPCAFWITTVYHATLYSDFLGFDPAYSQYSPGIYLMVEVIDRLSRDLAVPYVRLIDFGVGDAEYKVRLGNRSENKVSLCMFAPTTQGLAFNVLHAFVTICNRSAERLLTTSGLLPRFKRTWRNRLRAH